MRMAASESRLHPLGTLLIINSFFIMAKAWRPIGKKNKKKGERYFCGIQEKY